MTVYMMARVRIHDRATYRLYEEKILSTLRGTGGRLLAFSDTPELVEGKDDGSRVVLASFPSREQALAWYHSPAYQAIAAIRRRAAEADIIMTEGLPQPSAG